jgi:hypothetical protein
LTLTRDVAEAAWSNIFPAYFAVTVSEPFANRLDVEHLALPCEIVAVQRLPLFEEKTTDPVAVASPVAASLSKVSVSFFLTNFVDWVTVTRSFSVALVYDSLMEKA